MFSYTFPASAAVWGCVAFLLSHRSRATFIEPAVDTNLSQAVKFVFQCSRIQRSLPARRWLRLSLKLNLVLSESLQVFPSQLRDCTPAQQDDITAGSKLLQDLVLKLTGVTTRLAIMENGEGGMETGGQGDAEQPDLPLRRSQLRYKAPLPPLPATVITTSPDWSPAAETLQGVREFYNCNMTRTHRTTYKTSIYIFKKWSHRKCK